MPTRSRVERVVDDYRNLLLSNEADLMTDLAHYYAGIRSRLNASIAETTKAIADAVESGNVLVERQQLLQLARYQSFLAQATGEQNRFATYAASSVRSAQYQALQNGVTYAADSIRAGYLDAGRVAARFDIIPTDAIGFEVGYTRAGTPLADLIRTANAQGADRITAGLVEGIAQGLPVREIARAIFDAGLNTSLDRALLVARTETIRAYRAGTTAQYQRAGIKQYRRIAAHNPQTCPACLALDGKIYDTDTFDSHPACRCSSVPVLPGIDYNLQTGEQWLLSQSEDIQRQVLGPARYEFVQNGGNFADLATVKHDDTWGPTIAQTPVSKLGS